MEDKNKKCSKKIHSEIDAVSYCQECKLYFCNKWQNLHFDLHEEHEVVNIKNKNEIFENICKEIGHKDKLSIILCVV
jgi:hypothetical protein